MNDQRRVKVTSIEDIVIESAPVPQPGPGEVLVRSTVVGICGSDLHAAHGRHPFIERPFWPGHEVVGKVAGVGADVDESLHGQRVVIEPNLACGECEPCQDGRYNICDRLDVFGCQTPGGLTDAFVIAQDRVIALPDDLEDQWAALVEPMSTPVHAVRRAGELAGKRVVVFGAGPIGLFITLVASLQGAQVVVADLQTSKGERAVRLGAAGHFDPTAGDAVQTALEQLGGKAHVVFDAVAREQTVRMSLRDLLGKGGRYMLVGVPAGATTVDLELVQDRELELVGNLMFVREDVLRAIEILRSKPFPFDDVVTGVFPFEETPAAFAASDDPEQVKILITLSDGA